MRWTVAAILCSAFWLTGCEAPRVVESWPSPDQPLSPIYDYGAGGRDLRLIVQGNPFPMTDDAFARAVENEVQVPLTRQPTRPRLAPGPTARPNYAVVFVFQPSPTFDLYDACQMRGQPVAVLRPDTGQRPSVKLVSAFCVSGRPYSGAYGWVNASAAEEPQFRAMMQDTMAALFRPDMPNAPGGNGGEVVR
jgi:hypothetical protein